MGKRECQGWEFRNFPFGKGHKSRNGVPESKFAKRRGHQQYPRLGGKKRKEKRQTQKANIHINPAKNQNYEN